MDFSSTASRAGGDLGAAMGSLNKDVASVLPGQPGQPSQVAGQQGATGGLEGLARKVVPELPAGPGAGPYAPVSAGATSDRASSQPTSQPVGGLQTAKVPPEQDPFLLLARDHETMRQLLKEYRATMDQGKGTQPGGELWQSCVSSRAALIPQLVAAIVTHASAEEQVVHELYKTKLRNVPATAEQAGKLAGHGVGPQGGAVPAAGIRAIDTRGHQGQATAEPYMLDGLGRDGPDTCSGPSKPTARAPAAAPSLGDVYFSDSLRVDQANKDALYTLEHADLTSAAGVETADAAFDIVDAIEADHLRLEDEVYFPALRKNMTPQELVTLHGKLVACKAWAPTHSHPAAPDKPLLAKVTHPLAGLLDRARDALLEPARNRMGASALGGPGQQQVGAPQTSTFQPVQLPEGR